MKALVLGAGGFIGGQLFNQLNKDHRFTEVVGQSRRYKPGLYMQSPQYILYKKSFDIIFNCAGHANPNGDVDEIFESNVTDLVNLLSCIGQTNPPIFIHLSSIVVENTPLTIYAASKACSEIVVKSFSNLGKIRGINLRPCGVVGGNSTHGMLHDIIRRLKNKPEKLDILSSYPGAKKPYIHVQPLVNLMLEMATGNSRNYYPENCWMKTLYEKPQRLTSTNVLSVESVINIILKTLDINIELNWKECPWIDQPVIEANSDFIFGPAECAIEQATKEIWQKINS